MQVKFRYGGLDKFSDRKKNLKEIRNNGNTIIPEVLK